jgi:Flp pilus assembly protein TadD
MKIPYLLIITAILCLALLSSMSLANDSDIETLKQAIKMNPDDGDAYYNLGAAYGKLNMHEEEIEAYKQATRINPNGVEAHNNLGLAYSSLGMYKEAIKPFKETISIRPDHDEAHFQLGLAYNSLGMYQEAVKSFEQSIRINPDEAVVHNDLGVTYYKLGKYKKAIKCLKQAIWINPAYTEAHNNLDAVYGKSGNDKETKAPKRISSGALKGILAVLGVLWLVIVVFTSYKSFKNDVIFFDNYLDLTIATSPIWILIIAFFVGMCGRESMVEEVASKVIEYTLRYGFIFSGAYNLVVPFIFNRSTPVLAFCVMISRQLLVFVVPFLMLFVMVFCYGAIQKENESHNSFAFRNELAKLKALAILSALAIFMVKLINGDRCASRRMSTRMHNYTDVSYMSDEMDDNQLDSSGSSELAQSGITEIAMAPSDTVINKKFTNSELFATPDMRPGLFDVTVDAWLVRIGSWGKLNFEHQLPGSRKKRKIPKDKAVQLLTAPHHIQVFGEWVVLELEINKIKMSRTYMSSYHNKKVTERIFLTIDLKKEIRDILDN